MKHQGMRKLMALLLTAVLMLPCVAASAFAEPASGENGSIDGAITVGGMTTPGDSASGGTTDPGEDPDPGVNPDPGVEPDPGVGDPVVAPPAPVRDASLRSISIACGELYPAFDPQIFEYTVYVTAEQSEKSCAITAVPSDPYSSVSVSVSGEEKFVNTDIKRKIRVYNGGLTEEYTLQIHVMDNSEYYANGVHYEQMNEPDLTALPGVFRTVSATGFKGRIAQSTGLSMLLVQYEDSANAEHTIWRRYEPTSRTLTTVSFVTIEGKKYISCDSEDNILFLNNKQGDMYYIKNADGQVDLLVRTDNVALEEKSGLLSHISTAALLAVIAVLLAAGVWLLLNWKKMKIKNKKSEEIAYFRPYLSSYTEEQDGQRERTEK